MKLKTKLIASIMSICLVCAVFAIGVFALKTANLKIGGDVSFTATGVEATIAKTGATANSVENEADHFKTVTIDTTQTQSQIDASQNAISWSGLNITLGDSGRAELEVSITNNADKTTEADNYIEVDYSVDLGTAKNAKISISPKTKTVNSVEHVSDYIIAPGETDYFTIAFVAKDVDVDASLEDFSFNIVLNHIVPAVLESTDSTNYYYQDINYFINTTTHVATVNGYKNSPKNVVIPAVVKVKTAQTEVNYIVEQMGTSAFQGYETLESIVLPNSVKVIQDLVFPGCVNLTTVILGKGLTRIGSWAFTDCAITSIVIPEGVVYIGSEAFDKDLTSAEFKETKGWIAGTLEAAEGPKIVLSETDFEENAKARTITYYSDYWYRVA